MNDNPITLEGSNAEDLSRVRDGVNEIEGCFALNALSTSVFVYVY